MGLTASVLVQDCAYAEANCYLHQLLSSLSTQASIKLVKLDDALQGQIPETDKHLIFLQQRKLDQYLRPLARAYAGREVVIYDQDPWEAYRDASPSKGCYGRFINNLNVKKIVVTTRWWARRMVSEGLPAQFARIWLLPEYCDVALPYDQRSHEVAFIGTLHSYRRPLIEALQTRGIHVKVFPNSLSYRAFLVALQNVSIYVYSAMNQFTVNRETIDLRQSLWAKDVEAMSQGCFVLREYNEDADSFVDPEMSTHLMFNDFEHAVEQIRMIRSFSCDEKRSMQCSTVEHIRQANCWKNTAHLLLDSEQEQGSIR